VGWWVSVVGGLVVLLVLWDVFHSLWHPTGQGIVSHSAMASVWRLSRRAGRRARQFSGPAAMAAAIGSWFALVILGGALVYWPYVPSSFGYSAGLEPGRGTGFVEAFYLSVVTTTTLGFGDIVPTASWLRVLMPFQALVGFVLLTAAVAWVLQVYPALTRRRALALRLAMLGRAGAAHRLTQLAPESAARLLDELTTAVAHARVDFTQYAESYYFEEESPQASLALTLPHAVDLAGAASASLHAGVRLAGEVLDGMLDDLAETLDLLFLRTNASRDRVFAAYAEEHAPEGR
jgi:hypothetical protein